MRCARCKRELTEKDFYRRSDRPNGLRSECKKCTIERKKTYKKNTKPQDRFTMKAY